ncbi:MAG TPA: metal-dependent hydrolase [Terriglobales bacterium]|nr:metal-dependent hydrolase [Terriglobales bacterium]
MEPITHFLTGAAMGRAGFNRKTALATLTMTLAAEAPDLDIFTRIKGPVFGFAHHRGITHTFVGIPFVAAFVLLVVWIIHRVRMRSPQRTQARIEKLKRRGYPTQPRWGLLYVFALVAGLSHILLDFTNNYGVRPFEPFSYRWYSWDIVFIFEPLLYAALLGGLLLPALFRLINEEIGAKSRGPRGRAGAICALVGVVVVWGVRDYQHRKAIAALNAHVYQGAEPVRVSAYPYPLTLFTWYGVVETHDFYEQMQVDSLTPEVDPHDTAQVRYKPQETAASVAAKSSYLGRVYLDWAQYPLVEVEQLSAPESGYLAHFQDLRFMYPNSGRHVLSGSVQLDDKLHLVREWWGDAARPD